MNSFVLLCLLACFSPVILPVAFLVVNALFGRFTEAHKAEKAYAVKH